MTTGISLNIDEAKGEVSLKTEDDGPQKHRCFGDVVCGWSEPRPYEAILADGSAIVCEGWYCNKKQAYVASLDKCPLKLWLVMAVPVGLQNI